MKVWDRATIELMTPGSAVRHVTDCAMLNSLYNCIFDNIILARSQKPLTGTLIRPHTDQARPERPTFPAIHGLFNFLHAEYFCHLLIFFFKIDSFQKKDRNE